MKQPVHAKWPAKTVEAWSRTVEAINEAPHALALSDMQPAPPASLSSSGTIVFDNRSLAGDVIDLLPALPQKKLRDMRQALDDFLLLSRDASDKWNEVLKRKNDADTALLILTDHDAASRWGSAIVYKPADIDYVAASPNAHEGETPHESSRLSPLRSAMANLARAKTELAIATDLRDARAHRSGQLSAIIRNCETYLKSQTRGISLKEHPPIEVDLKKSETISSAIDRARKEIAKLGADLHSIRSAPIPSSVVKARARAQIGGMAADGRPDCFAAIESGEPIKFPHTNYRADTFLNAYGVQGLMIVDGVVDTNMPSTFGVMAWLFTDQLTSKVESWIDQCADDANALSDADRAKKLAATHAEILEVERQEEALIEMAATQGHEVGRRPEADPRAVLGIDGPPSKLDH